MRTITKRQFVQLVQLATIIRGSFSIDAACHKMARDIIQLPDGVDDYTKGGWIIMEASQHEDVSQKIKDLLDANSIVVKNDK